MTSTHDDHSASGRSGLAREGDRRMTAAIRLVIGLVQGVALWWLTRSWTDGRGYEHPAFWPATDPWLFGWLFIVFAFVPVVLLAGVGRLRPVTLAIWGVAAAAVLAALAFYDIDRQGTRLDHPFLSPIFMAFTAVALFIAHHLVAPADMRAAAGSPAIRPISTPPPRPPSSWPCPSASPAPSGSCSTSARPCSRSSASTFLGDPARARTGSPFPITFVVFATAVHLTDVRDGLIRGVRTVGLMLLSWLLLVMTVLAAGFVAALPFTGLNGLWETGSATALVLSAAGSPDRPHQRRLSGWTAPITCPPAGAARSPSGSPPSCITPLVGHRRLGPDACASSNTA
jgi:hypothetical protein